MASMREIKRRKSSIQSTGQITRAMKLVSTVKLQKARGRAERTKAYSDSMYETVQSILAFRHAHRDLDSDAPFKVLFAPKAKGDYRPFAWRRGKLICAVNPAGAQAELPLKLKEGTRPLFVIGSAEVRGEDLILGDQSFAVLG